MEHCTYCKQEITEDDKYGLALTPTAPELKDSSNSYTFCGLDCLEDWIAKL